MPRIAAFVCMLMLLWNVAAPALAQPQDQGKDKDKPPFTVAILGDSLASGIGEGMTRLLKESDRIQLLRRAKPATGLTRYDQFNWQTRLEEITTADRFDAAVVLMGTNDKQAVFLDSFRSVPFGTDEWDRLYSERFENFVRHLTDRGIWVIWIGLPAMQSKTFDKGIRHIDGLYRKLSARNCVTYLPTYERTVDDKGQFAASGDDIGGRKRVMRNNDGIHFTMAGYDVIAKAVLDLLRTDVVNCNRPAPKR